MNRRQLLTGMLVGGVLLPRPARAQEPAPLRERILPDPDFTALRETDPCVIGVRPHRTGGVRLELEPAPLDGFKKQLVHNYGHGGAGITLSWGCAAAAVDLVAQALARVGGDAPRVAIVGTGVIGLTTATEIKRRWPASAITVYARDLDVRATTSFVAAGQFEPSGIWREYADPDSQQVLSGWVRAANARILELHRSSVGGAFGIAERLDYELTREVPPPARYLPTELSGRGRVGLLPFARLNEIGREWKTWLVNPTILLPRLVSDLGAAGVRFRQRAFASRADLAALPEDIVVNCTGYGARKLVGDERVVPQRGHLVMLDKTDPGQDWFFSGGCANEVVSYVFCRQTDIVVGGTILPGQDSPAIGPTDAAVFAKVLGNAGSVFAGHPEVCVP